MVTLAALADGAGAVLVQATDTPLFDIGAVARFAGYLGLFLAVGAAAFRVHSRKAFGSDIAEHRRLTVAFDKLARRWGLAGVTLFLLGTLLRLYHQSLSFLFPGDPLTLAEVNLVLFESGWGSRWLLQLSAALVALVGFWLSHSRGRMGWLTAAAGSLAVCLTLPLTGHAAASQWSAWLNVPLQALHLLAGAVWLGSLTVLLLVAFQGTANEEAGVREDAVARLVEVFSPVAIGGVAFAVLAGVVLAANYLGSFAALWSNEYGVTLLLKTFLVAITGLTGAVNWRLIKPRLGNPGTASVLRRSAMVELSAGVLLLLLTAVMVALPAPHL